ncbi:hypothetical protein L915_12423 [Phytophthora nicotianae]|uniref:Uncharacterized protein n=1 Tax=Phytophthora nicotianae TaxID=4792 RepID=W2GGT8_PHYNI|nr:hypothetical protein L915_12423 [Phytophthora nicotianae]
MEFMRFVSLLVMQTAFLAIIVASTIVCLSSPRLATR